MIQIFHRNQVFLILFFTFWLVGLVARFCTEKGDFLMYLGTKHTWSYNQFFSLTTQIAEGHVFVIIAIIYLFSRYKTSLIVGVSGVSIMIIANLLKTFFAYERPFLYYRNLGLENAYQKIDGIEPYVGMTSFPSGHTMAGFALMFVLSYYLKRTLWQVCLLLIAVLVGISRIYLGHHFLEDVISGSMLGILVSILCIYFIEKWEKPGLEKSLKDILLQDD